MVELGTELRAGEVIPGYSSIYRSTTLSGGVRHHPEVKRAYFWK